MKKSIFLASAMAISLLTSLQAYADTFSYDVSNKPAFTSDTTFSMDHLGPGDTYKKDVLIDNTTNADLEMSIVGSTSNITDFSMFDEVMITVENNGNTLYSGKLNSLKTDTVIVPKKSDQIFTYTFALPQEIDNKLQGKILDAGIDYAYEAKINDNEKPVISGGWSGIILDFSDKNDNSNSSIIESEPNKEGNEAVDETKPSTGETQPSTGETNTSNSGKTQPDDTIIITDDEGRFMPKTGDFIGDLLMMVAFSLGCFAFVYFLYEFFFNKRKKQQKDKQKNQQKDRDFS